MVRYYTRIQVVFVWTDHLVRSGLVSASGPLLLLLLQEVLTEQRSHLLSVPVVCGGRHLVCRLWTLLVPHRLLPALVELIPVHLADVVQHAAGQDHGGHYVHAAVVPLQQTLPARSEPQEGLVHHASRPLQPPVKRSLSLRQPAGLREALQQPALQRVSGVAQHQEAQRTAHEVALRR